MGIEIKAIVTHGPSALVGDLGLPAYVPAVSLVDVQAVVGRSKHAARLRQRLADRVEHCGCFSRGEVSALLARAGGSGKRADADQAVVIAYYAQQHPQVFAPEARDLVKAFLVDVDWSTLMADLRAFIADLQAREAETKRAEQLKQDLLADALKRDDQKRARLQDNGTRAERKKELQMREAQKSEDKQRIREASPTAVSDELTGSGRLSLSDVELAKLQLLKKGFAHRE